MQVWKYQNCPYKIKNKKKHNKPIFSIKMKQKWHVSIFQQSFFQISQPFFFLGTVCFQWTMLYLPYLYTITIIHFMTSFLFTDIKLQNFDWLEANFYLYYIFFLVFAVNFIKHNAENLMSLWLIFFYLQLQLLWQIS